MRQQDFKELVEASTTALHTKTGGSVFNGTEISNPLSSRKESANFRSSHGGGAPGAPCQSTRMPRCGPGPRIPDLATSHRMSAHRRQDQCACAPRPMLSIPHPAVASKSGLSCATAPGLADEEDQSPEGYGRFPVSLTASRDPHRRKTNQSISSVTGANASILSAYACSASTPARNCSSDSRARNESPRSADLSTKLGQSGAIVCRTT